MLYNHKIVALIISALFLFGCNQESSVSTNDPVETPYNLDRQISVEPNANGDEGLITLFEEYQNSATYEAFADVVEYSLYLDDSIQAGESKEDIDNLSNLVLVNAEKFLGSDLDKVVDNEDPAYGDLCILYNKQRVTVQDFQDYAENFSIDKSKADESMTAALENLLECYYYMDDYINNVDKAE